MILTPNALIMVDNRIFFSDRYINGLFSYNIVDKEIIFIGKFQKEEEIDAMYYCVVRDEEYLYFIPFNAEHIAVYDMKRDTFEYIFLPCEYMDVKGKFRIGVIVNDELYMFGYETHGILVYNIKNHRFRKIYEGSTGGKGVVRNSDFWRVCKAVVYKDYIFAVSTELNALIKINELTDECTIIFTGDNDGGYSHIVLNENFILLVPYKNGIFKKYDITKDSFENMELKWKYGEQFTFCSFYWKEQKYVLLPYNDISAAMIYDFNSNKIQNYVVGSDIGKGITNCLNLDEKVFFNSIYESGLYMVNKRTNQAYRIELVYDVPVRSLSKKRIFNERKLFDIKEFIEYVNGD